MKTTEISLLSTRISILEIPFILIGRNESGDLGLHLRSFQKSKIQLSNIL